MQFQLQGQVAKEKPACALLRRWGTLIQNAGNPKSSAEGAPMETQSLQIHVQGLRAVAVLLVIVFHLGGQLGAIFGGGFIGVDVFFVISGDLISNSIYREIAQSGHFDFQRFYIRRMRRILPALLVTIAVTFVVAVLFFGPERFRTLGAEIYSAVLSVSNILFWLESGYFDAAAETKPLLHTWSLGVEEQFYLVWPALLFLAFSWSGGAADRQEDKNNKRRQGDKRKKQTAKSMN